MFGGQNDNNPAPQNGGGSSQDNTLNGVSDLADGNNAAPGPAPAAPTNGTDNNGFMPAPDEPSQQDVPAPDEEAEDVVTRAGNPGTSADAGELLDLKQQALQQLTPIVGHLSQTPEEKFRTLMMLIQAFDNQALLKNAYDAAQAIEDEKVKAQALLDVVNEINYFTQNNNQA